MHDISQEAMQTLSTYAWPGNVRELKSTIECALIACKGTVIQPEDLPPEILHPEAAFVMETAAPQDEKTRMVAALESVGATARWLLACLE